MAPLTGTYAHTAVAMRADQLIRTHGRHLQALNTPPICENDRLVLSVFTAEVNVFFSLMLLIAEMLLKTQGCIHNE
jgi:hypothetical protein